MHEQHMAAIGSIAAIEQTRVPVVGGSWRIWRFFDHAGNKVGWMAVARRYCEDDS